MAYQAHKPSDAVDGPGDVAEVATYRVPSVESDVRNFGKHAAGIVRDCCRKVALAPAGEAKVVAFRQATATLAAAVTGHWLPKQVAVNRLYDIALAHGSFGLHPDQLQQIMSDAFRPTAAVATSVSMVKPASASRSWRSSTVSAEALRTKQFAAPQVILPGMIVEGVTIFAGKPKTGKSWLALDVCIAVSGDRFTLGSLRPKTGDVLYLALEDSQRRLQRRVKRRVPPTDTWRVRLTLATDWRRLDEGGLDDLVEWCDGSAEPRLIVIDTLAKIRPASAKPKAAYDLDYQSITGLQEIAKSKGIAILVIHHTRKADADDVFDTVSGTLGLTGAADAILVLQKRGGSVTLSARGRDIEESETALQFNKEACRWTVLGAAAEVHRSNERGRIVAALTGVTDGLGVKEIMTLGEFRSRGAVDVLLGKMVKDGEVERVGRGLYRLPSPPPSVAD